MTGLSRGLFLVLTLAALWLFARRPASRTWSIALLLAVGWLDILTHEPWQNPTAPPSVYEQGVAAVKLQLKPAPDIAESRIMISPFSARQLYYKPAMGLVTNFMVDRVVFLANCNLMDDMPKVDGFFPLDVREVDKVLWLLASRNAEELEKLEDFLSVSHTIAPGTVFDWVPRTHFIPIATIGQAPVFAEAPATYSAITDANTDFRKVVYLPMEAKATVKAAGEPRSRILAKDFANNRQSMDVETPAPTMLVLCQTYYHNWKATVDGANVPLWRANYAFQAVEVPAGRHRVVLTYSDNGFRVGEAVSLASVLACAAGWLALRRASA
jgi:hypothetical protein